MNGDIQKTFKGLLDFMIMPDVPLSLTISLHEYVLCQMGCNGRKDAAIPHIRDGNKEIVLALLFKKVCFRSELF